jgi:hypothetical protein
LYTDKIRHGGELHIDRILDDEEKNYTKILSNFRVLAVG